MLSPTIDTIRLFLHILSAAIWVGGQFALAGIIPGLRHLGPEATKIAAEGFARVAWPAFVVAVVTGIWGTSDLEADTSGAYLAVLGIKLLLVVAAGGSAGVHAISSSKPIKAITGALGGVFGIAIVFLGVLLGTHG